MWVEWCDTAENEMVSVAVAFKEEGIAGESGTGEFNDAAEILPRPMTMHGGRLERGVRTNLTAKYVNQAEP